MLYICTLSWQGKDKLLKLKKSLLPALAGLDYQWFIKDNGSSDGSVEEIRNWNDVKANIISCSHNKDSYSRGMNILFREASPKDNDIVLTLNNDVLVNDTQSIKDMLALVANPEVGVVGAKLNYTDTDKIQHCGVLFNKYNGFPFHYRAGQQEAARDRHNRYYQVITGAVAMLRADAFANCYENKSGLKGFNEDYFFAFEDVDMCLRTLHNLKKKNVYCGTTNIFHEESASLKKNPVHKMFFDQNCKVFMENWKNHIDTSLNEKYEDAGYNIFSKKAPKF